MTRPRDVIDACVLSHACLLDDVAAMSEDDLGGATLLPGWTRGHLLTHLARNADSHAWLFEGARIREFRQQYPEAGMRERDIEAGSSRRKHEIFEDLTRATRALEAAWALLEDDQWATQQSTGRANLDMAEIVFRRLREVEIHHVDLDVGYLASNWPELYVEGELHRQLAILPERADHATMVAWLVGRRPSIELEAWW